MGLFILRVQQGIDDKLEEKGKLHQAAYFVFTALPILVQRKVFVFDFSGILHICKKNAWKMKTKAEWMKA